MSTKVSVKLLNPLNAELKPIFHLLALVEAHHILHVSRVRVNAEFHESPFGGVQVALSVQREILAGQVNRVP